MRYDTGTLRQFILQVFDDEELDQFCFDHFPIVHNNLTTGMTKGRMVMLLLDHCRREGAIPALMAALRQERPYPYQNTFLEETGDE